MARQGWTQVSYQQLGSQPVGFEFLKACGMMLMEGAVLPQTYQVAHSAVLRDPGHEVPKCLCGAACLAGTAMQLHNKTVIT